VRQIDAPEKMC